uniref:DUF4283 domain-containing protein n=1 Tax=Oryza brachyantha TaxID=4533 RepID=J3MW05_ORYBR
MTSNIPELSSQAQHHKAAVVLSRSVVRTVESSIPSLLGDLARVLDGAPWSCGGDSFFVLQRVRPDVADLADQVRCFKAELWVRFYRVPAEYVSEASLRALATHVGELVKCPDLLPEQAFFRARIRVDVTQPLVASIDVRLEDGEPMSVPVVYDRIESVLCARCRMLGHPADWCSTAINHRIPGVPRDRASHLSRSRSRLSRESSSSAGNGNGSGISPVPRSAADAPPIEQYTLAILPDGIGNGPLPSAELGDSPPPNSRALIRLKHYFRKYLSFTSSRRKNPAGDDLQHVGSSSENMEVDAQSSQTVRPTSDSEHTNEV